jgi:hypothetical protein
MSVPRPQLVVVPKDRERLHGFVLVRGVETLMYPQHVGSPCYWGKQGRPCIFPSYPAAVKGAAMQGGVIATYFKPVRGS